MLVLVLPLLTATLPARFQSLSPVLKDKHFAGWSCLVLALGQLCLGFAPVAPIAVLGALLFQTHSPSR